MTEGDEAACQLVVTGLLEKLQNIAGAKEYGYEVFEPYLRRRSLMAWNELALEREYRQQEMDLPEIDTEESQKNGTTLPTP
jgi:hypothetical protein